LILPQPSWAILSTGSGDFVDLDFSAIEKDMEEELNIVANDWRSS